MAKKAAKSWFDGPTAALVGGGAISMTRAWSMGGSAPDGKKTTLDHGKDFALGAALGFAVYLIFGR